MPMEFVLVPGPMVRASSLEPTARHLEGLGHRIQLPDVLAHRHTPPAWREWTSHLAAVVDLSPRAVLVGHSSATALIADLAARLPCRCLIMVDGEVPPSKGAAAPIRPALRELIERFARPDGTLPIWSRWQGDQRRDALLGLDILGRDPSALAAFESDLPEFSIKWFDDIIELSEWDHIPAGFIQTSAIHNHSAAEARHRDWPVVRLDGTHLHPTLSPAETADAIVAMSKALVQNFGP
ncbi:alpha/beta hydrolase [Bradyrhizobium oligotrophicum]|uniref:alpha/beta hydrolase n=2 Tax=Bradyrhizobium TaxID=374 RepID=UPI002916E97F|nr:alpha/beta hydrolase [Bradyrhizobium sp. SZCCHNS1050]